jgi:hypothetical protein
VTDEPRDRAYLTEDEVDKLGELTDTEIYEGELEAGASDDLPGEPDEQNIEMLNEQELREGETADPNVAAEEGMAWVPPIDPPVVPDADDPEGARVAAGFGVDAFDEPFDADHHSVALSAEDELEDRIREALRADSATSRYADSLAIGSRRGKVVVRGVVDDIDDTDNIAAVVSKVTGVDEVVDELEVAGVTD